MAQQTGELNIDVILRDDAGCLTVAGPLRLLERLVGSLLSEGPTMDRSVEPVSAHTSRRPRDGTGPDADAA